MTLGQIIKAAGSHRDPMAFDDWATRVQSICGRYHAERFEKKSVVSGHVGVIEAGGVDIAHIANDLGCVRREAEDIRRDYGEYLFLLLQLEGTCGIEQKDRQELISPGDCILVDSSRPSVFHFAGRYSNHISVHLPRQLLFTQGDQSLDVARRLAADDPMSVMLGSLIAKLMEIEANDKRGPHLRQLLFDATRQAFATQEEAAHLPQSESTGERLEIVQVLIDRHLTEEQLSPRWLAEKLGVSLRTLQDDLTVLGTTPTSMIRLRRLQFAKEQLQQQMGQSGKPNIAQVAFSTGFNDISYFNRCFREAFHCTPKDVLSGRRTQ
jgi:AraC-like DNA-binding protein